MSSNDKEEKHEQIEEEEEEEDVKIGVAKKASANDDYDDNDDDDSDGSLSLHDVPLTTSDNLPLTTSDDRKVAASPLKSRTEHQSDEKEVYRRAWEGIDQVAVSSCDNPEKVRHDIEKGINNNETVAMAAPPSVARVNEKGIPQPTSDGGIRRYARQRAMLPGAEYVRGRAPGARPIWYVQHIRRESMGRRAQTEQMPTTETSVPSSAVTATFTPTTVLEESAPVPSQPSKVPRKAFYLGGLIVVLLIFGAALGVGIALGTRNKSTKSEDITSFSPFTKDCQALVAQAQPNFMSQCLCDGKITNLANDITIRYIRLSETFMLSTFPDFHESLDSCSPHNQALVWLASGDGIPSEPTMRQRYLLALLYITWNGPSWTSSQGWLSSKAECSWLGVKCSANNEVVEIGLRGRNLSGNLGSDFALITTLTSLSLDQNNLRGKLPTELVGLPGLRQLSLSFNALTGSIPDEYGSISQLKSLIISGNHLQGTLPSALHKLSGLETLLLSGNTINGTLPTEFGQLKSLQSIGLDNNTLTGVLPTEIGLWTKVEFIDFSFNSFAGATLPSEIGLLSNLTSLSLLQVGMNGNVPLELFGIRGLQQISISSNNLHGSLPSEIGRLTKLNTLNFDQNLLTGTIPIEFGNCTSLQELFLNSNSLNGTIPSELGLIQLRTLDLIGNNFTGTMPKSVCAAVTPLYCYVGLHSSLQCDCCNCPGGAFS